MFVQSEFINDKNFNKIVDLSHSKEWIENFTFNKFAVHILCEENHILSLNVILTV